MRRYIRGTIASGLIRASPCSRLADSGEDQYLESQQIMIIALQGLWPIIIVDFAFIPTTWVAVAQYFWLARLSRQVRAYGNRKRFRV